MEAPTRPLSLRRHRRPRPPRPDAASLSPDATAGRGHRAPTRPPKVFENHRIVFTVGTSIASVLTAWAGYSLRQVHQSRIERRLESIESSAHCTSARQSHLRWPANPSAAGVAYGRQRVIRRILRSRAASPSDGVYHATSSVRRAAFPCCDIVFSRCQPTSSPRTSFPRQRRQRQQDSFPRQRQRRQQDAYYNYFGSCILQLLHV
ncbi:hypothetical protein SORBI_3004G253601 [Sorghum bicolor]|uniref:Uncharacterized protein n=1 Tax=Sorghum bicolor TaxID=4558 RepID=A0A1Z5RQ18_SORBI|nr:hypothetical protein SORBI_3004G253601 [Sorghum bicolor]